MHGTLQSLLAPSAAPGTVRTYEATSSAIAPKVSAKLSLCVFAKESEGVFYAFCTAVLLGSWPYVAATLSVTWQCAFSATSHVAASRTLELCKVG